MIPLSPNQVSQSTGAPLDVAQHWLPFLQGACKAFEITTPKRIAAFLAQIGHESGGLRRLSENLNYSATGLRNTWPHRFPTYEEAWKYHRRPEAIANRVYANRMGNGDEASGDGWKYRGRGLIQLTGKDNYRAFGDAVNEDFVAQPDLVMMPVNSALSAAWFWQTNGLNRLADAGDMVAITRRINGGTIGLADRMEKYARASQVFEENQA